MNTKDITLWSILIIGIALVNASNQIATRKPGQDSASLKLQSSITAANVNFAFRLFKVMSAAENAVLSPFSVSLTLAMVMEGAKSSTLAQIQNAIYPGRPPSQDEINKAYSRFLSSMRTDPTFTLLTANRLYVQDGFAIKDRFVNDLKKYYNAEPIKSDFEANAIKMTDEINVWIANQTNNKIKDILNHGDLSAMTRLVIVNAIYFKSNWKSQFDLESTKEEAFYLKTGDAVMVPMMSTFWKTFNYIEVPELNSKVLQLDYLSERVVMYVILPNEKKEIEKVKSNLNRDTLEIIATNKNTKYFKNVKLPKFSIKKKENMELILKELNVTYLFDEGKANLRGIADPDPFNLFANKFCHEAYVNVNEKGTEASAATVLSIDLRMLSSQEFIVDHPFIFIIYDTQTKFILFIGEVDDPSK